MASPTFPKSIGGIIMQDTGSSNQFQPGRRGHRPDAGRNRRPGGDIGLQREGSVDREGLDMLKQSSILKITEYFMTILDGVAIAQRCVKVWF